MNVRFGSSFFAETFSTVSVKLDKATEAPTPLHFRFAPKATVGRQHAILSFSANCCHMQSSKVATETGLDGGENRTCVYPSSGATSRFTRRFPCQTATAMVADTAAVISGSAH